MAAFLENALAHTLPLDGEWAFSLAGSTITSIPVPSAWEAHVTDKRPDGPAHYRRTFDLPAEWLTAGRRVCFEADAISFHVTVSVNGRVAGEHDGLWSAFQLGVTELLRPGANDIALEVWKPGGRYPLRETLSGFLPDVITAFGGPWQGLRLRYFSAALADLRVLARPEGVLAVSGQVVGLAAGAAEVRVQLADRPIVAVAPSPDGAFTLELPTAGLPRWRPDHPQLHVVLVEVWQGGALVAQAERRVGLRHVRVEGAATWMDERPLHMRGVLDWGWHPELIRPTPTRAMLEDQFAKARSLGFNLIKLCLFVPDEATFDAADELGMLLWLELPMWLPKVTPALQDLARAEYAALLRRLHHHPSIVVLSLGCELNAEASAGFLRELDGLARAWLPNVLHCDNSGSAEAYGGVATALSDFYDYHFYTDPHFFQPLVEHFDRGYRPAKPWLYGEFCDADTGRDFSALDPLPWWLTDPVALERDDYLYQREHRERLVAAGITDGGQQLTWRARLQATAIRKHILELTRRHSATGGYVVSGWADTPITTSGMVYDFGLLKFAPDEWQRFNNDSVLLLDRERRRRWVGGDRPANRDPYSWWSGERAELRILLSNGRCTIDRAKLHWASIVYGGDILAEDDFIIDPVAAGDVAELTTIVTPMHAASERPRLVTLAMLLQAEDESWRCYNEWQLWVLPRPRLPNPLPVAGPLLHDHNFARLDRQAMVVDLAAAPKTQPFITDALTADVLEHLRSGGYGVLWLRRPDDRLTRSMPFWRESIHWFATAPLWNRVFGSPAQYADMRFFSIATDFALDLAALQAHLGPEAKITPMWRRFDARQLTWAEYIVQVQYGAGRLYVSTLRFEGGLGSQPVGFEANPWGSWLLAQLLNDPTVKEPR